ncbi:hypothetical protein JCM8115_002621 [Rhodotorula mucilaginosa]
MSTRTSAALTETDCSALQLLARGKVRDIYAVPGHDDALLFVATDRVSAFDVIMKNGIPNKGKLLTSLSLFFFNYLATHPDTKHIPNHVITSDLDRMPQLVHQYRDQLEGRSIWVRKATILPVEAIVRGYITGSAWSEYQKSGTMHGIKLPEGMKESTRFDPPLFTPSTKAEVGDKDINIHPDDLAKYLPDPSLAEPIKQYALALYSTAAAHSLSRGLILADTKFEFGLFPPSTPGGNPTLALVDECLTPDSSRFWRETEWAEGNKMVGFDKQFLREWLKSGGGGWGKKGGGIGEDPVEIPQDIVEATWAKYSEAYEQLTGQKFVA